MNKSLTTEQAMRYNRQILLPGFDLDKQEILLNSNVLLIGVGGLGCAAAQYLVAAGVGSITLVDDDQVDKSNLQRQILHGEADVGIDKCLSAKQSLQLINSDCQIECISQRLQHKELLQKLTHHDIIVDCCDNLATRNQLNQASVMAKTPLVSGAAIQVEGQVSSFIPSKNNACYQCLSTMFIEQQLTCVEAGVISPLVGIIGSMQALETIKVLTEYGEPLINKLMLFDGKSMQWQTLKIVKDPKCVTCSTIEKI